MRSEKEFLSNYDITEYERPSLTADVAEFRITNRESGNYKMDSENTLSILLVKRGDHPYKDHWALPGGFLRPGETIEDCALREITEETSVTPVALVPVAVFSDPGRDPRGWIISNAFASIVSEDDVKQVGGDDAADAEWFDVRFEKGSDGYYHLELFYGGIAIRAVLSKEQSGHYNRSFRIVENGGLAFDHAKIIASALTMLRENSKNFEFIFDFLPEKFTLSALQKVHETVMNVSVLPANFRRKISGYVAQTEEYTRGAGHRPAKLYKRK